MFRENETKPMCVCGAKKISLDFPVDSSKQNFNGSIEDFFPLMGSIIELISEPGFSGSLGKYVICWPDDESEEDKMWKKIVGLRFLESIDTVSGCKKPMFRAGFIADRFEG
ncbi:MAG: hypothetical protein ACTSYQ_03095 [Candidatus Odinarchaeia archaeon]